MVAQIPKGAYTMKARYAIIKHNAAAYRKATKKVKSLMLDELAQDIHITGQYLASLLRKTGRVAKGQDRGWSCPGLLDIFRLGPRVASCFFMFFNPSVQIHLASSVQESNVACSYANDLNVFRDGVFEFPSRWPVVPVEQLNRIQHLNYAITRNRNIELCVAFLFFIANPLYWSPAEKILFLYITKIVS